MSMTMLLLLLMLMVIVILPSFAGRGLASPFGKAFVNNEKVRGVEWRSRAQCNHDGPWNVK